jgi:glycosyltransferase involved in cell wall biosynthesis
MMAMGLPVVVSNVVGGAAVPGETSFLFPVGDAMSFANFLQTLSAARAASQFVAADFAADRMLDNYRETF